MFQDGSDLGVDGVELFIGHGDHREVVPHLGQKDGLGDILVLFNREIFISEYAQECADLRLEQGLGVVPRCSWAHVATQVP
jgi:hypothetical protein